MSESNITKSSFQNVELDLSKEIELGGDDIS
jgi:hypothetical protein